ncbi:MAG: amidase family protein, partial [Planctomycetia bacterium]
EHSRLNALVQPRYEEALGEAARMEKPGPLAGVPVSVKDCFAVAGLRTTLGMIGRKGCIDASDSPIVSRLRQAGAIVLGKANVPQAMYLHETDNPLWGRTSHPSFPGRGPGGSSGGDAALVASGCVALGIGNDLAGSIRQPAHACGIVGFLPRATILGGGGAFETMPGLIGERSRCGLLARAVSDIVASWHAIAPAEGPFRDARQAMERRRPLRVGWWDEGGPLAASDAVCRGVALAAERLRARGVVVDRLDPDIAQEAAWIHLALLSADGGADVRRLFAGERPIEPVGRLLGLAGVPGWRRRLLAGACAWGGRRLEASALRRTGPRHGSRLAAILGRRAEIERVVEGWSACHDAILCPVSALPALRDGTAWRLVLAAAPCLLANLVDLAAGTVPLTTVLPTEESGREWSVDPIERLAREADAGSAGLPVGVQVVSLVRSAGVAEETVLDVMRMLEGEAVSRGASP